MLCVIAKLDDSATEKLAAIRRAILPRGTKIKPLHGHVTLATYVGDQESLFIQSCKELLRNTHVFSIVYEKFEVLEETSILVATPAKSETLTALHQRIAEKNHDEMDDWTKDHLWHPHTTLLFGPQADLRSLCRQIEKGFTPFPAHISRIEFSRVLPVGYSIVDFIDLMP